MTRTIARVEDAISGVDFVLNIIGGETWESVSSVVKDGGRIITVVVPSSDSLLVERANRRNIALSFGRFGTARKIWPRWPELLGQGILKPHICVVCPFDQIARAHPRLESGRTVGKVVVVS